MEIKNNVNIKGYLELYGYTTDELATLTPNEGALAVNSTTDKLVKYDGANFLPIGEGDANIEVVEVTADYTITDYSGGKEVLQIANTSTNAINILGSPDGSGGDATANPPVLPSYELAAGAHITATLIDGEWRLESSGGSGFEVFSVQGGEGGYTFNYDGDAEMVELVNDLTFDQSVSGAGIDTFQIKSKKAVTMTKLNDVWYPSSSTTEPYYFNATFNATSSWADQGDTYTATINLSGFPNDYDVASVDIRDSDGKAVFVDNTVNGRASITIDVSKNPDARFAGTVKVIAMK